MAPLPKRKHSKARKGKRRSAIHLTLPTDVELTKAGTSRPHRIDKQGMYKGVQIIKQRVKKEKKNTSRS